MLYGEFCSPKQSLELRNMGFDDPCFAFYRDSVNRLSVLLHKQPGAWQNSKTGSDYCAPLRQQVFKWFRENHNLDSEIYLNHESGSKFYHYLILSLDKNLIDWKSKNVIKFKTHEEAQSACIDNLIQILKEIKWPKILK